MTAALRAQFERCRPWLAPAVEIGGETSLEEVLAEVLAGRAQLWAGEAGCIVSQCVMGPAGGSIHGWLSGGTLQGVNELRPGVEAFGRAMGCTWATLEGRTGWERVYRRFGFALDEDGVLRKAL